MLGSESCACRTRRMLAKCISVPSNSTSVTPVGVAKFARPGDDQIEHRLWIARRGRHRLQHVDGRGLLLDPLAVFAVALLRASRAVPRPARPYVRQCRVELCRNAAMML